MDTRGQVNDIVFFDGVCNLCNGAVNFIIDRDQRKRYQFASLQSAYAENLLKDRAQKLDSIVLLTKDGQLLDKSSAVLEIARRLKGGWFLLYGFKIIPKPVRDRLYDFIAKNRYKWFGRRDFCKIPTPELKERFLEAS
ncbi:MAG: thiol-disulfide oxidoreductase DCC family protein [Fulvivirga sp.]|nr:thiol-disulfide oxidoreductase DCC family protein [Fulvivirga sp.]